MPVPDSISGLLKSQPRWRIAAAGLVLLGVGFFLWRGSTQSAARSITFSARRGPLDITVVEGGSIQAEESQEIKCEVRVGHQGLKILKIVEEGYLVTEENVRTNKVLVELDTGELEKQIIEQEIQYQSAAASYTDAQQGYEIQLNQNFSDLKAVEQKVRFARMDFDKFLGTSAAQEVVDHLGLEAQLAAAMTNSNAIQLDPPTAATNGASHDDTPAPAGSNLPASAVPPAPASEVKVIEFAQYAKIDLLGDGEAKQTLRKFEDDLQVARKELGQAQSTLDGTKRLFEKGFVTKTDLERDEIAYENNRLKVQTADTARDLFLKYEFTKLAEESLSKYAEAVRELDRARKAAISKLAQAEARLKSAQGQFSVQTRQRKELQEQLAKCVIRAQKPGLVIYGPAGEQMFYYGDQERIREGATVRERQTIITIPDMTRMSVNVKIHESYIKRIKKGQKARITVDAFPDKSLTGEVTKVGVLPDSQNRWMNPDMKVYVTTITIDGTHDWIKPGMSSKVEVMVSQLTNVVHVPIQAVFPKDGKYLCHLVRNLKSETRTVEVGEMNDEFIEIKSGLMEGEAVLLRAPAGVETGKTGASPTNRPASSPAPAAGA